MSCCRICSTAGHACSIPMYMYMSVKATRCMVDAPVYCSAVIVLVGFSINCIIYLVDIDACNLFSQYNYTVKCGRD